MPVAKRVDCAALRIRRAPALRRVLHQSTMIGRLGKRFAILLATVLLLAQQGAVLHVLSHAADVFDPPAHRDDGKPDPRHCDLCVLGAQLGAGAAPSNAVTPATAGRHPAAFPAATSPRAAPPACAYHSRAPPRLA
jgi:hypothetical protein